MGPGATEIDIEDVAAPLRRVLLRRNEIAESGRPIAPCAMLLQNHPPAGVGGLGSKQRLCEQEKNVDDLLFVFLELESDIYAAVSFGWVYKGILPRRNVFLHDYKIGGLVRRPNL